MGPFCANLSVPASYSASSDGAALSCKPLAYILFPPRLFLLIVVLILE
nr:MAG TPA: hypothetical protein [Caudoviricetes sp.]